MSVLFHRCRFYALLPMSCYAVTLPSRPCLLYCPAATVCCHNNCHFCLSSLHYVLLSLSFLLPLFLFCLFPQLLPCCSYVLLHVLPSTACNCPPYCPSPLLSWFCPSPLCSNCSDAHFCPTFQNIVLCTIGAAVKYHRVLCFRELHLNHNLLRLLPYELGKLFNLQVLGLKVRGDGTGQEKTQGRVGGGCTL